MHIYMYYIYISLHISYFEILNIWMFNWNIALASSYVCLIGSGFIWFIYMDLKMCVLYISVTSVLEMNNHKYCQIWNFISKCASVCQCGLLLKKKSCLLQCWIRSYYVSCHNNIPSHTINMYLWSISCVIQVVFIGR